MKRFLIVAFVVSASAPAVAQHAGHGAAPSQHPHAGHGTQAHPPAPQQPDPHARHRTPRQPQPQSTDDPHAGHRMEEAPEAEDPHAGHRTGAGVMEAPEPPMTPPPTEALSGPRHAADVIFGTERMAEAREETRLTHGALRTYKFAIDQLEISLRGRRDGYAWEDVQFWYGGDINKLWIKSEGEGTFGEGIEQGDVQLLWSRAIDPWFDLQAGVRMNFGSGPERPHLVLGVQGLAPYWFEIDAALFLSSKGDLAARLEGEYDLRITQRLILQPRAELEFSLQDVPELRIGSGLSSAEGGLRLRYEIVPEFAPYFGIQYERAFGDTARFLRAAGEDAGGWSLLLGVKAWF